MTVNLEKERQDLLDIHTRIRQAHLEHDAELMVSTFANQVFRVSSGAVSQHSRDELQQAYEGYFSGSTYHEMNDLEPPIIRIAKDASMAWMIARTKVRLAYKDGSGNEVDHEFIYAGIVTYEKQDGEWRRTANVVTVE